jgi:hypothetical protein
MRTAQTSRRCSVPGIPAPTMGGAAATTSLTAIWLIRHVIAQALHEVTAVSIG